MTKLNPLEEVLFQAWARANGVSNHDDPSNFFDHRGLFKQSNGLVHPRGLVGSIADTHNKGVEAQQESEGGDTVNPDPFMAQAEMHKANLDAQGKAQADRSKMELEHKKMEHASMEKEKDRNHKLQLEHMKTQQKAQADQMKVQAQAQEAERARQSQMQMAHEDRAANMQQADADRQVQVQQGHADRQATAQQAQSDQAFQAQNSQADRKHEMAVTEKQAALKPPPATTGQSSGLHKQLMNRAMSGNNHARS